MASTIHRAVKAGLIHPPKFLPSNVHYEVLTGSVSYGVSSDTSDMDVVGFCIPPKDMVFPHLAGEIDGFGRQKRRFDQYQQHHVMDPSVRKEYDFTIYSIVKFFSLCMENNPNMVDVLFVPRNCILHSSSIGEMVREHRKMFLHKGCFHKFKGFAYSQLSKMENKTAVGKRKALIEKFGFDVKYAYHVVRLMLEVEQIMVEGDLDLQRGREQLKAIRRGEVSVEEIKSFATEKEKALEKVYHESKAIPHTPDEAAIKQLLMDCLEHHYGSLSGCVENPDEAMVALRKIEEITTKALHKG